ncbi:MAG: hypothetical protein HYZ72_00375 [Deltaproteobacteria bacterium]|nr:hypothetical protein [Deltaproteobacteria bacterium]
MEGLKERIRYYTEWIRLLWVGMFLIGGGGISLLLTLDSHLKVFLLVLAALLESVFATLVGIAHRRITALIEHLEEGK